MKDYNRLQLDSPLEYSEIENCRVLLKLFFAWFFTVVLVMSLMIFISPGANLGVREIRIMLLLTLGISALNTLVLDLPVSILHRLKFKKTRILLKNDVVTVEEMDTNTCRNLKLKDLYEYDQVKYFGSAREKMVLRFSGGDEVEICNSITNYRKIGNELEKGGDLIKNRIVKGSIINRSKYDVLRHE